MDPQNNARSNLEEGQLLLNADVRGWTVTYFLNWLSYTRPNTFAAMVKALSRGHKSSESEILRRWGIRRSDVAPALSHSSIRVSDVSPGSDEEGCSDW